MKNTAFFDPFHGFPLRCGVPSLKFLKCENRIQASSVDGHGSHALELPSTNNEGRTVKLKITRGVGNFRSVFTLISNHLMGWAPTIDARNTTSSW